MASRTRIISQSKAVYVSPTGILVPADVDALANAESGYIPDQLHRIDTFSFDVDLAGARTDVREFGQLARIGVVTMSEVSPSFSMGYYLGNGENEARLGFNIEGIDSTDPNTGSSQFISGMQTEDPKKKEKNIYCITVKEGQDAFDSSTFSTTRGDHDVVAFGNCFFNSYTANFAVGEIPRVDIEGTADNLVFYTGASSGLANPALDLQGARADTGVFRLDLPSTGDMDVLVLRPDDVNVSFSVGDFDIGGTNFTDVHAQSATIEVPLARDDIEALGAERSVARPIAFPIDVTMSISALLKNFNDGALDLILTGTADAQETNIAVKIDNSDQQPTHHFMLQNCVLDSQNFALGLDDNETVDLTFSAQIGGANQSENGLFYSGNFYTGTQQNDYSTRADFLVMDDLDDPSHTFYHNRG
jgi:hypothetical protein